MISLEDMISVEEARERILSFVRVLEPEEKPLLDALGQVLVDDVTAGFDIPPADNTAMDGYAVQAASTEGATSEAPVELRVLGYLPAGYVYKGSVGPGEAVRIMTGAPIPEGADSIVPFEETDEPERAAGEAARVTDRVKVYKAARPGANVRYAAEDVRIGAVILPAGKVLRPADVGVIASLGYPTVRVIRRPVVAILSTGDEITPPGEPLKPGRIYDSNSYSIAALTERFGGIPKRLGIARDTLEDLTAKVSEGLDSDMLITSAGVSRGDFDVVKDVLAREGQVDFWTVRMKPGKPLAFGYFDRGGRRIPHIGLPGNPVSSMLTYELFGRPAIYKMLGREDWPVRLQKAIADQDMSNNDGRRFYARCVVAYGEDGRLHASLTGPQGSGILTSMALANALAILPEERQHIRAGEEVDVWPLD
jgi:molybdopterin molybdotransferase